jgi:putative PEP-CTERM system TPR-repeat lipoprotein
LLDTITTAKIPPALQPDILTLRGSAQAMMGNLTAATASFAQARQLNPSSALPLIAEAPLLLRAGEREQARAAALKATELAPKSAMAWYQLGAIQQSLGDRKSALASLEKAIALEPKLVDAQVSKASLLLVQGQTKEAGELLARLKAEKVVEPRASFLRATMAEAAGNPKQAAADYTEAANLIDGLPPGIRGGSEPLLLAGVLSHRWLGNPQRAREYVDAILTRNPRHAAANVIKASLLLDQNEINRAVVLLENLLRTMPDDPQVLYMMGSVHMSKRQFAQASAMFERASRAGAGSSATRELALSQLGLGQDKSALGNLEQAYAKNPRDYRAGIELAVFHARRDQGAKAVAIAQALVDLDPKNPAMLNFLGNIKGRISDNAGMRVAYERALAADPKFKPTVMNMSMLDMDEGRFDAARARLTTWLKTNEADTEVMFLLGNLEQRAGRLPAAIALWSKADGLQNRDPRPGLAAVEALLALRKPSDALAAARTLNGRYPDAVPVQLALANAQLATGDAAQARLTLANASKSAGFDVPSLVSTARRSRT